MKSISRYEWAFLAFILFYSFVPTFGGLLRVVELLGGPVIVPENPRALSAPLPTILHILSSFLFCLLGAVQFLPNVRRHNARLHRRTGRVVAVAGCLSALTGLWMTHFHDFPEDLQGVLLYWIRIALSLAMVFMIVSAVIAIRSRNVLGHGAAMIRAYAIGQGASTQAVFGMVWMVACGSEVSGLERDVLMISSWCLNLLIAEVFIRRTGIPIARPT